MTVKNSNKYNNLYCWTCKFLEISWDSNSDLKLLTFQLSHVRDHYYRGRSVAAGPPRYQERNKQFDILNHRQNTQTLCLSVSWTMGNLIQHWQLSWLSACPGHTSAESSRFEYHCSLMNNCPLCQRCALNCLKTESKTGAVCHWSCNFNYNNQTHCRSCAGREINAGHLMTDISWLTPSPINNLAVGQYINNQNPGKTF